MTKTKNKSIRQRLLLFASSCCVFLLLVPSFGMVRYFLLYLLFVGVVLWHCPPLVFPSAWSKKDWVGVVLVSVMLVVLFLLHWNSFVLRLCHGNANTANLLMTTMAVALALGGSVFLAAVLRMMKNSVPDLSQGCVMCKETKYLKRDVVISILLALLVMTVCSCLSPLYATNTWCSPACYHTVGKSLWSGLLPYRDLYEHKGPLVYALYSVATLISYKSYFGMYLLSLPFAFFFFFFSRKTLRLLTNSVIDPWFIVVGAGIYCTTSYFCGGSVEELLLPFLAYALYVATSYVVSVDTKNLDKKNTSTIVADGLSGLLRGQCFFIGVGMAVVLWTKFNILAFYIALTLFILIYIIHNHRFRDFRKAVIPVMLGLLAVTLPVCLFYGFHGALDDLFQVYFHDNLFLYMDPGEMMWTQGAGHRTGYLLTILALNIRDNSMFFLAVLIASLWLRHRNTNVMWLYLLTFAFTALFVFVKPDYYKYYCFILAAFVPFCVLPLSGIKTGWLSGRYGAKLMAVVTMVAVVLVVAGSDNLWKTRLKKDDYIQFRFARTIMKEPRPTLLNYYCQDQGLFAVTGIVPTDRFYCDFNNDLPIVHEVHDSIVANRRVQFVVSMYKSEFEGYTIVDQAMCPVKGVVFYLYKRN